MMQRITFKGEPFLLIEGAIATPQQYEDWEESYAHLFPDGRVLRHQQQIGTKDDIVILGPYEE